MKIRPTISRHCAGKLLHAALTNQGDVLGYNNFGGPGDDEDEDGIDQATESDREHFLMDLAADSLRGDQPAVLERVLKTRTDRRMDPATAAIMMHLGIIPAVALILKGVANAQKCSLDIVDENDDDRRTRVSGMQDNWEITLDFERDVHWNSYGTLIVDTMPETIATSAQGRMLREILTHPALDPLDLIIQDIDVGPSTSIITLKGYENDEMETLGVSDLEEIRRGKVQLKA